jgi:hypothetical protein
MSEHPNSEDAAIEIMVVLKEIYPNGLREEWIHDEIVARDGWEAADVTDGLTYGEQHGWLKRTRGRVSATQVGIDALRHLEG